MNDEKPFGQVAFEAYQGIEADHMWVNPLPEPDQWDRCATAVIAEYTARLRRRAVIPPDRDGQFTAMAQAASHALTEVGAANCTDWSVQVDRKEELTEFSMAFDFGENAYFVRICLAEAGGAVGVKGT